MRRYLPRIVLMLGNFVTGLSILTPAGMLTVLADGLGVGIRQTGLLVTFGALILPLREAAPGPLSFNSHPQMLRHAYGFALAKKGHDTPVLQAHLVNKNIQHTGRFTELSSTRFRDFWRS